MSLGIRFRPGLLLQWILLRQVTVRPRGTREVGPNLLFWAARPRLWPVDLIAEHGCRQRRSSGTFIIVAKMDSVSFHDPKRNAFPLLYQLLCQVFSSSKPAQPRQRSTPHDDRMAPICSRQFKDLFTRAVLLSEWI
jgi:hypothetical protein